PAPSPINAISRSIKPRQPLRLSTVSTSRKMATKDPIVFTAPGLGPDMSIEVFKQIFHVNSLVLKVHSEYFRTYLNSPDKAPASSISGTFRYNWVTLVDEDANGWSLTAKENFMFSQIKTSPENQPFAGTSQDQVDAFHIILSALHSEPVEITTAHQLCLIAELADFYRVLPLMSNALNGVFFGNPELAMSIPTHCVILLEAAYKLRNNVLFRECFIHVMGPWTHPRFKLLQEKKLRDLAAVTHANTTAQITATQHQFLIMTSTRLPLSRNKRHSGHQFGKAILAPLVDIQDMVVVDKELIVPAYYRKLHNLEGKPYELIHKLKVLLDPFLRNLLVLDRSGVGAGEGPYEDSFLCFELPTKSYHGMSSRELGSMNISSVCNGGETWERAESPYVNECSIGKTLLFVNYGSHVHLEVFFQDFYVHSSVLKKHSAFFRAFLDSPDKGLSGTSKNTKYKYDWISHVDKDGTWALICSTKLKANEEQFDFWGDQIAEIKSFHILLNSFYGNHLRIQSISMLNHIIALADYYRALPQFSAAFTEALGTGTCGRILDGMVENCAELLEIAARLRCAPLFRDCFILCTGPCNKARGMEIKSGPLRRLARAEFRKIMGHVKSQYELAEIARISNAQRSATILQRPTTNPQKFTTRGIRRFAPGRNRAAALFLSTHDGLRYSEESIRHVMWLGRNNLVLVPKKVHFLRNHFLCTEISDEDLPWDVEEKEW
ncbi:hypothetical protein LSUB1_G004583, partial [Lachnellula subtilissima]